MTRKIKIGIDISPTIDGNSLRGIGYYTQNLINALQKEITTNSDYKNWAIDLVKDSHGLQTNNYDLIHYPYFDPFKLTLPKHNRPTVVTVHDLIPIQFKTHFPPGIRGYLKWLIQKKRLQQATKILTVSEYSRQIISKIANYPLNRIAVAHLAADSGFRPITNSNLLQTIKQKYHLPERFVLFVGDINWNKNIPNLVRACKKAKLCLVIVGSAAVKIDVPDHPWTKDLRWLQSKTLKLQQSKNLILTGFVPDEDLPAFYNLATVYCQPSFAEGFGLPLVQAMQSGCPVAYSQDTALPEVMDSIGLPFNPRSVEDIAATLKKFWHHPKLCRSQKILGLSRARNFNWSTTARKTLSLYSSILLHE